mmetsp:Transcript_81801/g.236391  ORF Transcript_81801/g.236391 Transcript_81801/m.236391 type:complete len:225 (+) Transcript_81801:180-854(+)
MLAQTRGRRAIYKRSSMRPPSVRVARSSASAHASASPSLCQLAAALLLAVRREASRPASRACCAAMFLYRLRLTLFTRTAWLRLCLRWQKVHACPLVHPTGVCTNKHGRHTPTPCCAEPTEGNAPPSDASAKLLLAAEPGGASSAPGLSTPALRSTETPASELLSEREELKRTWFGSDIRPITRTLSELQSCGSTRDWTSFGVSSLETHMGPLMTAPFPSAGSV